MDRNVTLSIIKGRGSEIKARIKLFEFLHRITTNEKALEEGRALQVAARENPQQYDLLKRRAYGFINGHFS